MKSGKGSDKDSSTENLSSVSDSPLKKIASIDIGSNTLRLLIAWESGVGFHPLYREREIVRLGRNFYQHRLLSSQAMEDAVTVLKRFKNKVDAEGVTEILAVGTGVLREAENISFFLKRIEEETRLPVRIISGIEEARIMAQGVLSVFPSRTGETIIFDAGGGSTEFVFMDDGQLTERFSLPLGAVLLTEQFLRSDPPSQKEIQSLKGHCRNILKKNLKKNDNINALIGTAGTVITLTAMMTKLETYDPDRINGTVLTRQGLKVLSEDILPLSIDQRVKLIGLEPGRADIIIAGLLLVLEIMDHFSREALLVSDAGLLEGLIA